MALYYRYRALHPSGTLEEFKCPAFFSPREVAAKLQHSALFMHVPKRRTVMGDEGQIVGPCWMLVTERVGVQVETPTEKNAPHLLLRVALREAREKGAEQ